MFRKKLIPPIRFKFHPFLSSQHTCILPKFNWIPGNPFFFSFQQFTDNRKRGYYGRSEDNYLKPTQGKGPCPTNGSKLNWKKSLYIKRAACERKTRRLLTAKSSCVCSQPKRTSWAWGMMGISEPSS